MTIEELQVLITANTKNLQNEINKVNSKLSGLTKTADKTQSGVLSAFKKLKTGIIAVGIGKVIKDSIQLGMDAVESDSLFEVSLGKMSDIVRSWSEELQEALGVNAVEIRKNTGTIYNMTTSMGLASENALKMSKGVAILSNDMASFYNISEEEAFDKIQSGLTGMSKPLKDLGILVDDNTITQVAYQEGIAETGAELTEQQKVLARYVALLKQTGNAQGDLARTIDSPANSLRLLKSQVQQLGLAFSNILMPVVQAVLPYLTAFAKVVTKAVTGLANLLGIKGNGTSSETEKISDNVGGLSGDLDDANSSAKKLKNTLAGFDEMNVLADNSSDSSSTNVGSYGGTLDFDLSEYNAHLEWVDSATQQIADKIENAFKKIGKTISSIWDSKPVKAYTNFISTEFNFIKDLAVQFGTDLWTNMSNTWSNIQENVSTTFSNISTLFTNMWTDMSLGIETWGQPIIDGVSGLFNSIWKDAIDPYLQKISKIWSDFTGILVEKWNQYGKPLVDNIGEFVKKTIDLFQSIWDNILEPIITPFLETLSWLWDNHLKGMIENVIDFVGKLINGALEIYNKFIQPIVMWLIEKLAPAWSFLSSLIVGVLGTVFGVVSDVFGAIFKVLGGVVDFITGIFTGNWKKAWQGVKDIFKGIIDGLVGIFKLPINLIIDGINAFIKGLNKIKIPDWVPAVGGKGFNIAPIPKLAKGGIVDSPTITMVGEAGKEAVLPLERNTGWIDQLADKINNRSENDTPIHIVVNVGEETMVDKIIQGIKDKDFETNGEVFNL